MQTAVREIAWTWRGPVWLVALLAAAASLWVIFLYAREQPFVSRGVRAALAGLRLIALAIVLVMFAQPTIERSRVARPRLIFALDQSASMETRDVAAAELGGSPGAREQVTRVEAMGRLLAEHEGSLVAKLRQRYDIEFLDFAGEVRLSEVASGANLPKDSTQLGEAIDYATRCLAGVRPSAVIMMTDGINTRGLSLEQAAHRAHTAGVPVYAVAIGSERPRPDVAVVDVRVEQVVFPGDRLQVEAAVGAVGYAGKGLQVSLVDRGSGKSLAQAELTLPTDGETGVALLTLRPMRPGVLKLAAVADVQVDESDTENNLREFTVEVREQPVRTLLVTASPNYEFRAIKSLLERDPAISLKAWVQDADANYSEVDAAALRDFPAGQGELLKYDVIILGDVDPELMPRESWDDLRSFVSQHGGGLALVAGPRFTPAAVTDFAAMRTLLPADVRTARGAGGFAHGGVHASTKIMPTSSGLSDATMQIGENKEQSERVWGELPNITWMFDDFEPKAGAIVLASARRVESTSAPSAFEKPVILRQYLGAGEVLMHMTDESWRWRWRSDDRYFARYWGQAVRRLARGRAMRGAGSLATDRPAYEIGDAVALRARLRPDPLTHHGATEQQINVQLVGDCTQAREVELIRNGAQSYSFETILKDLPADHYYARLEQTGKPTLMAEFRVNAPPTELTHLAVNTQELAAATQITGGRLYSVGTAQRIVEELSPPRAEIVERLPTEPIWNSPWMVASLCLALGAEWLVRRRAGLM